MKWSQIFKETSVFTAATGDDVLELELCKLSTRTPTTLTYQDAMLSLYIKAAEIKVEQEAEWIGRQKTFNLTLACWPDYCDYLLIRLEHTPIQSVTHIKYYDEDDVQQTLSSSLYEVWLDHAPPVIAIKAENVPYISTERSRAIEVRYIGGVLDPADINEAGKLAMLEFVTFLYRNPEAFGTLPQMADGAQGRVFESLINSLRWRAYP